MEQQTKKKTEPERLRSLDALRGFDMFWIMGTIVLLLAAICVLQGTRLG